MELHSRNVVTGQPRIEDEEEDEDQLAREPNDHGPWPARAWHSTAAAAWLQRASPATLLMFGAGVWNNAPYVIMLASAKQVSEGGVALVFLANILPGTSSHGA